MNIKRLSNVGGVGSKDYVQEVGNRVVSGKEAETILCQIRNVCFNLKAIGIKDISAGKCILKH